MITQKDLCTVIKPDYVLEGDGSFQFHETDPGERVLRDVDFQIGGHFVALSTKLLKDSAEIYNKQFKETHLRSNCDKVVLLNKDGKDYIVWVEVKTSLNEIYRKGIFQFPGCYYRTKALLDNFASHTDEGVQEFALAIYAEDAPPVAISSSAYYTQTKYQKINPIPETAHQKIENKYKSVLKSKCKCMIEGSDFGMGEMPILDKYKFDALPCVVWPVAYTGAVVNMDDVIALL